MSEQVWWRGLTVLVTGASSGIGEQLARGFAAQAGTLVLLARREERLRTLADELSAAHAGLRVHVVQADLADTDGISSLVTSIEQAVGTLDVLVNNAGLGDFGPFVAADPDRLRRIVDVNVVAPLLLAREVLPGMVDRRRGGVLFIGSGAGQTAMKNSATYSASKHFVDGLVESLRLEVHGTGVVLTQVCPGPVPTEFDAAAGAADGLGGPPPMFRVSARQCADEALRGFERRAAIVYPGAPYRALMTVLPFVPRPLMRRAAR